MQFSHELVPGAIPYAHQVFGVYGRLSCQSFLRISNVCSFAFVVFSPPSLQPCLIPLYDVEHSNPFFLRSHTAKTNPLQGQSLHTHDVPCLFTVILYGAFSSSLGHSKSTSVFKLTRNYELLCDPASDHAAVSVSCLACLVHLPSGRLLINRACPRACFVSPIYDVRHFWLVPDRLQACRCCSRYICYPHLFSPASSLAQTW